MREDLTQTCRWFAEQKNPQYWPAFFAWRARFNGGVVFVQFPLKVLP